MIDPQLTHRNRETVQLETPHYALVAAPLGREWVGFPAEAVVDVFSPSKPVRVPRAPAWVSGVIQREGQMVTLVDLSTFCGLPPAAAMDVCIRVRVPDIQIAFVCERVAHIDAVDGLPVPIIELPLDADWVDESLQIGPRTVHCIDLAALTSALREGI